jgi:hypothetical protein
MTAVSVEEQIEKVVAAITKQLTSEESNCALYPVPKRIIGLYPGDAVAWDTCCDGQLSFRLVSLAPKYLTPGGRTAMTPCSVSWWDVVLEVQLLRCVPTIDSTGKAPTPAKLTESGLGIVRDMETVLKALTGEGNVYAVGQWTPVGPNGGCVGGRWQFTFRADPAPC